MAFGWSAGSWAGSVLEPAAHTPVLGGVGGGAAGAGAVAPAGPGAVAIAAPVAAFAVQLLLLAQSWEAWLARGAKVERPTGCLASYGCNTLKDGFGPQSGNAKWQTQRKTTGCTST